MSIRVRIIGAFVEQSLNTAFEEPFTKDDTPQAVFTRLDKRKALGRRFFTTVVKRGQATFLLNGDRLDLPNDLKRKLNDGDEISVLSAIAGG
ncbi:MoaD/ThiS family protein [Candidatus Poribacteria bacterium]|nr:MoaD/ThiS family protein [Candidatus Poribacteria bacterium]